MNEDRYVFVVEWFDSAAALVRSYNLTYYIKDSTIDMYDIKNKRVFLKRSEYPSLQLGDLFIGATISIYARQLKVVDFADQFTRGKFENQTTKALMLIKPDAYVNVGKIIAMLENEGIVINNMKMCKMGEQEAQKFYANEKSKTLFKQNSVHLSSDLIVALEVVSENCVNRLITLAGPSNPQVAKKQNPNSIRAVFGSDEVKNAVYVSQISAAAPRDLEFFFAPSSNLKCPAYFTSCSCAVVKPHILAEGKAGQVIDMILRAGFEISAMQIFRLDRPVAEQFYELYKTVLPEYSQIIEEAVSGPCIAMEVRQKSVVPALRELCGPHDPELARSTKPNSVRAVLGRDKARNAVHCTDLPDDALLEVEYFFNILQK